jgi:hypothetical protein
VETAWALDSVAANVYNLPRVLAAVRELTGLQPFLRFELELTHGVVPVAQVMCGDVTLEFLEHARGQYPAGASRIRCVLLHVPGRDPGEREMEPGLWLAVQPGPKPRLAEIQVQSNSVDEDVAVLRAGCGAGLRPTQDDGAWTVELGDTLLRFSSRAGTGSPRRVAGPGQRLPGWHRIGLACQRLEDAVSALVQAGAQVEVPPYQVLPGLREAMLRVPSGLVVQLVEQKLWQMLPVVGVLALMAKLAGQPLRFKTRGT